MDNIKIKAQIQAIIDAAKELRSGGESIHNVYGELSISLERLAKLVRGENKWKVTEWDNYVLIPFLHDSKALVDKLYNNQKEIRSFLLKIALLISVIAVLIYFVLPIVRNNNINLFFASNSYLPGQVTRTYSQELNNPIQLFIAISTFLAVLVALFGEKFWRWVERPKIRIDFDRNSDRCFRWANVPLCNIQDEGQIANVKKYYFRLKITNNGGEAKKLRVRADIKGKNGKEVERFEPSTLQWINKREEVDLLKGESEYVNFLSQVVNQPNIKNRLTIEIFDTSPRGIAWDRRLDQYEYLITIYGENIKPVSVKANFLPDKDQKEPGELMITNL